jgi:hypothetical protein
LAWIATGTAAAGLVFAAAGIAAGVFYAGTSIDLTDLVFAATDIAESPAAGLIATGIAATGLLYAATTRAAGCV